MTIETQEQALAEAQERFGKGGYAYDRLLDPPRSQREMMDAAIVKVGRYWVGNSHLLYGNGNTWDAAFADADSRALNPSATEKQNGDKEEVET